MVVALFTFMKPLYLQLVDPCGQKRCLKLSHFPLILGTDFHHKNQLRDQSLKKDALLLERKSETSFSLRVLQEGITLSTGDLHFSSIQLPYGVSLTLGDTELTFALAEMKDAVIEFPAGVQAWYTESKSGFELLKSARKASETKLSIYLSGDTGTGKEVLAKLIHLWSERSAGAFVPINCGALALSLAESELFGHVKGSFTGAVRDRPGALLQAHGGTLFLDEVGDLPLELQVKLLRFLENGEIKPVGSDRTLLVDVRIVCATHKPLLQLVKDGKFRQDLYFRLASIPIEIPKLRSRPEDIRMLALHFSKVHGKMLTEGTLRRLQMHAWPGNVRELRHAVERACGLAGVREKIIHAKDFDFLHPEAQTDTDFQVIGADIYSLKAMEKILIKRALKFAQGNRGEAAKILGIARSTLFERMKKHRITGQRAADLWVAKL
jgi:transcriptional regulator with PAS, ATPase and Fis domain